MSCNEDQNIPQYSIGTLRTEERDVALTRVITKFGEPVVDADDNDAVLRERKRVIAHA